MKRVPWFCLALCLLLAFSVYGGGAQETKEQPQKVSLRYWMQTETIINDATQELLNEYQEAHPNVEISMDKAPHGDHVTRIYVSIAGEAGPDFFVFPEREIPRLLKSDALAPVNYASLGASSAESLKAEFSQGALDGYFFNGVCYAIPSTTAIYSWAINKDHFTEVGLNPETQFPRTWDDVISAGRKLVKVEGGRMVREPVTFPFNMAPAWYVLGYEPILYQLGGSILNADHSEALVNSPAGVQALKLWYDMVYKDKIISTERATDKFDTEFANGTLSMWFGANWQAPTFIKYNPKIEGHFKIVPFPMATGGQRAVGTSTWTWMVMKSSKNQAEAWKVVAYFLSRAPYWLQKTGFIMPTKGLAQSAEAKSMPFANVWLDDVKYGKPLLIDLHFSEIAKSLVDAIEKSLLNRMPPEQALDVAAKEINDIKKAQ